MSRLVVSALCLVVLGCGGSGGGTGNGGDDTTGDDGGGDDGSNARTGLEGFCDHYKECGGTYYATAQECIDASLDYWMECRRSELDAFGDCMIDVDCDGWSPDTYNPANTACASEYQTLGATNCAAP